jgi:hypothetical protein
MDDMITHIVELKNSDNESDIQYGHSVAQSISDAFDAESMSFLVDFVPSIQCLIPKAIKKENPSCNHWQLVFLLTALLVSVLSQGRKIV